jgi:hypothetical protein
MVLCFGMTFFFSVGRSEEKVGLKQHRRGKKSSILEKLP